MTDVLTRLGLEVDSGQVRAAVTPLEQLSAAAQKAAQAQVGLKTSSQQVSPPLQQQSKVVSAMVAGMSNFNLHNQLLISGMSAAGRSIVPVHTGMGQLAKQASAAQAPLGVTSNQLKVISLQLPDIGQQLISGQSPFMIMIQQGGQVVQMLQMQQGGLTGFGRGLLSLLTPAVLVGGGLLAIGTTATFAVVSWRNAQNEIELSLMGIGRASGATAGMINRIAEEGAGFAKLSVAEARDIATGLAATGKIAVANILPITKTAHDLSIVFRTDVAGAGKILADAFSDPVAGADQLNRRLGFLDDKTRQYLLTLREQGDRQKGIQVLLDAMRPSLEGAEQRVGALSRGWTILSNEVSKAYTKLGQGIDRAMGGGTDEQRAADLQKQRGALEALIDARQRAGLNVKMLSLELFGVNQELGNLEEKQRKAREEMEKAPFREMSMQVGALVRATVPAIEQYRSFSAAADLLARAVSDPRMQEGISNAERLNLALAARRTKGAADTTVDEVSRQILLNNIAIEGLDKRGRLDEMDLARRRKRLELAGQRMDQAERERQIEQAAEQAGGGRTRTLQDEQSRISILGDLATVQQRVRATQIGLDLAAMEGRGVTEAQAAALRRLTEAQVEGQRLQERVTVGVATEVQIRQQLGRELQGLIDKKLLDPNNLIQLANAQSYYAKKLEQTADSAKVAAAPLEGLKRLETDAASLRKNLDTLGVNTVNNFENSLVEFGFSSDTAGEKFHKMVEGIEKDVLRMMIRMQISAPLAAGFQDVFKTLVPSAQGNVFSQGRLIPMGRGAVVNKPILFPMAQGAGLMGEKGPEGVMPLFRTPSGDLGVKAQMGGGNPIIIENHTGFPVEQKKTPEGSMRLVVHGLESYMADRRLRGQGPMAKADLSRQLRG